MSNVVVGNFSGTGSKKRGGGIFLFHRIWDLVEDPTEHLFLSVLYTWYPASGLTDSSKTMVEHDGKLWVAKTYAEWSKETWLTVPQIRSAISRLKKKGLVETGVFTGGEDKAHNVGILHIRMTVEV